MTDKTPEALKIAASLAWIEDRNVEAAADLLRSQHARIEALKRGLEALLDGTQHCGEMQWVGPDELSPWEKARSILSTTQQEDSDA